MVLLNRLGLLDYLKALSLTDLDITAGHQPPDGFAMDFNLS